MTKPQTYPNKSVSVPVLTTVSIIPFRPSWAQCPSEGSAPPTRQMTSAAMISTATMLSRELGTMTCNTFTTPPPPPSSPLHSTVNNWDDKDYELSWAEPSRPHTHAYTLVWFCKIVASSGEIAALSSHLIFDSFLSFRLLKVHLYLSYYHHIQLKLCPHFH